MFRCLRFCVGTQILCEYMGAGGFRVSMQIEEYLGALDGECVALCV